MTEEKKAKRVRNAKVREEIYPNIFRPVGSPNLYIRLPNGEMKYCSGPRFEKLLARAGGDTAKVVSEYRSRGAKKSTETESAETESAE